MSGVDDLSLEPVYLTTTDQSVIRISTHNYGTLGLSVAGTMSTGGFTVDGTEDGVIWQELPIAQGNTQLADNDIVAPGSYIVPVAGYVMVRVVPTSFTGAVRITPNVSKRVVSTFTFGV